MRTHFKARTATLTAAVVVMLGLTVAPADAAVPPNDGVENAIAITSVPFSAEVRTVDATTQDTDPRTRCSGPESTVWWTYTPTTSGWFVADSAGSNYDSTLAIFTGSPGSFTEIACNDDTQDTSRARVYWEASAGTKYYVMAGTCCGGKRQDGGRLNLSVNTSEPPFFVHSFTLDPTARLDRDANVIVLRGTLECRNGPERVYVDAEVRQRAGRTYLWGYQGKRVECEGTTPWRLRVDSYSGIFSGGPVQVNAWSWWGAGNGGEISIKDATVGVRG